MSISRRELVRDGAVGAVGLTLAPAWLRETLAQAKPAERGPSPYGPLQPPDENSLRLPEGFRSRMIARGNELVEGTGYPWPIFSDGQATFRTQDGGWILVTNSESVSAVGAGSSAIRFSRSGEIIDAYRILSGTNLNCAGGPTPWGTWLSCEEGDQGLVWECDPAGVLGAEARPALGAFKHEAAAVDPVEGRVYLTEDNSDASLYRFTPRRYPDLSEGVLEAAIVDARGRVSWAEVPDPSGAIGGTPTREQVEGAADFQNAEGIWYSRGILYFTTKADKVVWAYDARKRRIERVFDRERAQSSSLDAVDNVTVGAAGDVLICEDGGNMEIGLITPERKVSPLLRFEGPDHEGSEVCGVVFSPDGERLYCTSQRAFPTGIGIPDTPLQLAPGAVYEIRGPFRGRKRARQAEWIQFGPPAGELRPNGPLGPADRRKPGGRVKVTARASRSRLLDRGIVVRVRTDEASKVSILHDTPDLRSEPGRGGSSRRTINTVLDRAKARVEKPGGVVAKRLRPRGQGRRLIRRHRGSFDSRILVSVVDGAGNQRIYTERVKVGRQGS